MPCTSRNALKAPWLGAWPLPKPWMDVEDKQRSLTRERATLRGRLTRLVEVLTEGGDTPPPSWPKCANLRPVIRRHQQLASLQPLPRLRTLEGQRKDSLPPRPPLPCLLSSLPLGPSSDDTLCVSEPGPSPARFRERCLARNGSLQGPFLLNLVGRFQAVSASGNVSNFDVSSQKCRASV